MSDTNTTRARVEAALAERLKARIGPNAGILADDLLDDLIAAGGVLLPVRPNGIVWVIHRRRDQDGGPAGSAAARYAEQHFEEMEDEGDDDLPWKD